MSSVNKINRRIFSLISIGIGSVCIVLCLVVQLQMFIRFQSLEDGKTEALFGLLQLGEFGFRFNYLAFGLAGIISVALAILKSEKRRMILLAGIIVTLSIALIFIDLWKMFI